MPRVGTTLARGLLGDPRGATHVVTLKGAVPTESARARALDMAREAEGVDKVVDTLKVVGK